MKLKDFFYIFIGFTKAHKENQGSFIFLSMSALVVSVISFIEWRFMEAGFNVFSFIGLILVLIGFFIRWYGAAILKQQYLHVSMMEKRKLVKRSLYNTIRHPCYLGVFIADFGIALFFSSWAGLLAILLIILPWGLKRIENIEEKLIDHYGKSYKDYKKRTKKLIPGIY